MQQMEVRLQTNKEVEEGNPFSAVFLLTKTTGEGGTTTNDFVATLRLTINSGMKSDACEVLTGTLPAADVTAQAGVISMRSPAPVAGKTINYGLSSMEVNVDADHTTVEAYPDMSLGDLGGDERAAQNNDDEENYPGLLVYANLPDPDDDGVVGYADGIDKFGNGQSGSCEKFEPMLIRASSLDSLPDTKFVFKYSSSDPEQMNREGSGMRARYILPEGKILRLWKKDGDEVRKPQSAHQDGDFIRADQEYTPQQLGWQQGDIAIRLYIEVVETTVFDQSTPIDIEFYPIGRNHPEGVMKERVKIRPYYISRENPPLGNENLQAP